MNPPTPDVTRAPEAPLWRPSLARARATALTAFRARAGRTAGRPLADYADLHRWSIEHPESFWRLVWEAAEVRGEPGERGLVRDGARVRGARWFPDARLSFTENLLRGDPARPALIALREDGTRRELSLAELRQAVARWRHALAAAGVGPGERVAAWLPNGPEAVAAMLATAALGALWCSSSPDFGPAAVLDRFQPLAPRILLATDGHVYRGKLHDGRARLAEIAAGLPTLARVVVVPWLGQEGALPPGAVTERAFLDEAPLELPVLERFPFEHPLYVVFSSGTTGRPKCIVHGAGGTLLQHAKEHRLQCDVRRGDRVFFHTTLGWMMWNWLVSALASEATVVLYDGDPLHTPDGLLELAAREELTFFGCSARYFETLARDDVRPPRALSSLRTVASTGSPLAPEAFEHVYRAFGPDLHLASISGGTDILSCFVGGDPTGPVWRGELQAPGLGMDVDVVAPDGTSLAHEPGELVCRPPFPSMPLGFWDDPDDAAYRRAYFERFPGLWHHGDWAQWTEHGGMVILGRSDATLNVNGVRLGSAEITRELETFPEVREAVAVEVTRPGLEGIALVVVLASGVELAPELAARIRSRLRERRSPRHVPRHLLATPALPRTRSGKLSESAVRAALNGHEPQNRLALANPEVLAHLARLELA